MNDQPELPLTGRQRRRLSLARENGFLDASCRNSQALVRAYGRWCWRLRIPMVWFERESPYSRYGRLHLDMLTTPCILSAAGLAALAGLATAQVSAHEAAWRRVPRATVAELARAVYRAATQPAHYQLGSPSLQKVDLGPVRKLARIA